MATNISAIAENVKTQKNNEAVVIAAASNNQVTAVVHANATNVNCVAGEKNIAEAHVHAQAHNLQVNAAAGEVHIHHGPRKYPLLEKLKAKQMIEWEIPALSNSFIGREALLKKLDEQILGKDVKQAQETNTFVVNALKGLGGIGKTTLALQYIRETKQSYSLKVWFPAENITALRQKYFELAKELGFIGDKEAEGVAYLKQWFKEQPNWLLVLDNVNSAEEIKDLLPEGKGHIILTSRFDRWPNTYKPVAVPIMEEKEAIDLVLSLIGEPKKANCSKEMQELSTLVKTLQMLPLALVQAGAYINANKGISIKKYLELYQANEAKLFQKPAIEITERVVATTWNTSLQAIAKDKDMALGINILCACAYLNSDNIPLEFLFAWMRTTYQVDEISFTDCIEGLERYSMVKTDATILSIHRVAQQVIRHQQSGAIPTEGIAFPGLTSLWYSSLLKAANQEFSRKTHLLEDEARERVLLVHLQALQSSLNPAWEKELSEDLGRILGNIGIVFSRQGRVREAQQYLQNALRCKEMHFGKEHLQVAITLNNLGNAYGSLGDVKQEKELLERALKILEAHYGKDHVSVATTLTNLGNAYGALGDAKQKKALLERALTIKEAHYGKDHAEVAITLTNLGNAYGALGDAKQKKALLERALTIQEAHYGKDHAEVAITLTNLGNAYGALGNAKQQKALLERALKIKEAHYGKDHVEVAITLGSLGIAYGALEDAKQMKALLERALTILEAHYGKEHAEVAITLTNLGTAYGALGDAKQMKALLERALKIDEAHYGKDHAQVAITLMNLGNAYGALGDAKQKKELLERALKIKEAHYGKDHAEVAATLMNLGTAYGALGDAKQQKALLERALKIQEAHYGKDHVSVATTLGNLGNAYGALGDAKQQKALLERALKIQETHYGKDHVSVANTLGNLGNVYGALGDAKQKKELLMRALKIEEAHYGKEHPEVAITLFNLAIAYRDLKLISEAQSYALRAHHIFAKEYGTGHTHTLKAEKLIKSCQELLAKLQSAAAVSPLVFSHSTADGVTELQKVLQRRKIERDKGLPSAEVAFRRAAAVGSKADVEFLVKHVKDINKQDDSSTSKKTALHWAAKYKHQEVFDFLVSQGAKLDIKDAEGKTAEDYRKLSLSAKK